jgi:acyl-CoA reductase-like NAD-dependent aldehyde dehydrogenase
MLIDGELQYTGSGATFDVIHPATEQVAGQATDGTVEDMARAVGAARRAFDETDWSRDVEFRFHCLTQLHDALERNKEHLRRVLITEVGCPVTVSGRPPAESGLDVDPDSQISQEEIFGPVLTVTPYDTDDDAVAIANNSIYGLSGEVSSGDVDRALAVARRMRTGNVTINGKSHFGTTSPFGGTKQSGLGRRNGDEGYREYLEGKTIGLPG